MNTKTKNTMSRTLTTTAGLLLGLSLLAPPARADTPIRSGFTLELGLGGSFTHMAFDGPGDLNEFSHSMLTLSLGGFVSEDVALMFHMAGTTAYEDWLGDDVLITNQFLGAAVQVWLSDDFYLGGGLGLGLFGVVFGDDYEGDSTDYGLALSARAGYAFLTTEHHSLRLGVEIIPSFYDSRTVIGTALNIEWQYY